MTSKSVHLFIFILKHIFSGSLHCTCSLRRFSPGPRDKRNVSRDAFFMPGVHEEWWQSQQEEVGAEVPRCADRLISSGRRWLTGEIMSRPPLMKHTLFFRSGGEEEKPALSAQMKERHAKYFRKSGKVQMKVARISKFLFCE